MKSSSWVQSQKRQNYLCSFARQTIQYHSNPSLCHNKQCWRTWSWIVEDLQDFLELTPKKDVLFILGDWNAKVGSQETPGVRGKVGLGGQNEAGQRLTELPKRTHWSSQTPSSNNTREDSTHGHQQMVNIKIRLIICFEAKDGEILYGQQKHDWELTVTQIMTLYCKIQT